jgi:3-hexulose-6-phosphate synthase / 6-phospho-3-hexuloisomerase
MEQRGDRWMDVKRKLQVAIDETSIDRALALGRQAVDGGVDIVEAGAPLIKSEGISVVSKLKKELGVPIVADLKIIDFGDIEARLAFDAGADMVTVLCSATTATIEGAVEAAKSCGGKIIIDLIGVYDVVQSYNHVLPLKPDYLYLTTGFAQWDNGKTAFDDVRKLFDVSRIPLGVAGGLNAENISKGLLPGVEVLVVGRGITAAQDPRAEAAKLKKIIAGKN